MTLPLPDPTWTLIADAPLLGLKLAPEPEWLLVWDQSDQLVILDHHGERRARYRAPRRIHQAAISADGSLVAVFLQGQILGLLDHDLRPIADRSGLLDSSTLAVDTLGRYVVAAAKSGSLQVFNRNGRALTRFEPRQPPTHLCFHPESPALLGASHAGTLMAWEFQETGPNGLKVRELWIQNQLSNIGRLEITGDGAMILASCHSHGIQRFDSNGKLDGSYHPGGTVIHAVPDYPGRLIVTSTLEGDLAVLNRSGNVKFAQKLPRPAIALEFDALGRYLIHGDASGSVTRIDLDDKSREHLQSHRSPKETATAGSASTGSGKSRAKVSRGGEGEAAAGANASVVIRRPDWSIEAVKSDAEALTAILAVLDEPPRIALMTSSNRCALYDPAGQFLGRTPELGGGGRMLKTTPGWIGVATDQNLALLDAHKNTFKKLDLSLVFVTHLAIDPDHYGAAIVQECDRIGRSTPAGRWIWRQELASRVEELAILPTGHTAVTTDLGEMLIFSPSGAPAGNYVAAPMEPLCIVGPDPAAYARGVNHDVDQLPDPKETVWISLARSAQKLRGHALDSRVLWQVSIPWESWQLVRLGKNVLVVAADGRTLAYGWDGRLLAQSRADRQPKSQFLQSPQGELQRLVIQDTHLICSNLAGIVRWRSVADAPYGAVAAGQSGVAAIIGHDLRWFPHNPA